MPPGAQRGDDVAPPQIRQLIEQARALTQHSAVRTSVGDNYQEVVGFPVTLLEKDPTRLGLNVVKARFDRRNSPVEDRQGGASSYRWVVRIGAHLWQATQPERGRHKKKPEASCEGGLRLRKEGLTGG